jgi:hypothetical protein
MPVSIICLQVCPFVLQISLFVVMPWLIKCYPWLDEEKIQPVESVTVVFAAIFGWQQYCHFKSKKIKMGKALLFMFTLLSLVCTGQTSRLKYVVYDFDGQDMGGNNLPDGDYMNDDLTYQAAATPLVNSDVLGDRVLQLNLNWNTGSGEFGKDMSRFIDLDVAADRLNFYFYNPVSNGADSVLDVILTEDDNNNNTYEYAYDDKWVHTMTIRRMAAWQLISIPLSAFTDGNPGGNGIFDAGYEGAGSMLFAVGFIFHRTSPAASEQYFIDMISFSEGALPTGAGILDLPPKDASDRCLLGALANNDFPEATPDSINPLFSTSKLTYVNWFASYADSGTIANNMTHSEVSSLLDRGYTPVITWEMMYASYPRLDSVQPRLDQILDGSFDAYIDAFADHIKSYEKPVILRIFHEFEGSWYCWSLTQNGMDPNKYISAWRHVVDRFRARGANNVQWMWCVNSEPQPYVDYNWIVSAYPGSSYVDIVATDIYNHPDLGVPPWKSFRYTVAETYYYLTKYFADKPFYICEVASRERYAGEPVTSQSKGEWMCQMSRDLKSYFSKTKALIFFSTTKEHDWRLNSSASALDAANSCFWSDPYFGKAPVPLPPVATGDGEIVFSAYPNPFSNEISIDLETMPVATEPYKIRIFDVYGKRIFESEGTQLHETVRTGGALAPGIYILELRTGSYSKRIKVLKAS